MSGEGIGHIEEHDLGGGAVLHAPGSGALITTNSLGRTILHALRSGAGADGTAEAVARMLGISAGEATPVAAEILEEWRAAGLFETGRRPYPQPIAPRAPAGHRTLSLRLGPRAVTVRSEDDLLARQLVAVLAPYRAEEAPTGETIDAIALEGGFGVLLDGTPIWGLADRDMARHMILREVAEALAGRMRVAATLHAGAVEHAGGALIVAGSSGNGKSTLCAGLVAAGCRLAADDHVPVDSDGASLIAFPVRPAVKRGAWDLAEVVAQHTREEDDAASPRLGVRYLAPRDTSTPGARVPVRAIVFPEYGPRAANAMRPVPPEEALFLLSHEGRCVSRRLNTIRPLAALVNSVPAYAVSYSGSDYSVAACLDLLAI